MKQPNITPKPHLWASWFLEKFCAPHLLEEMRGDLEELYIDRAEKEGTRQANYRYVLDVLSLMRPFILKRNHKPYSQANPLDMITNYLTIAFRNLVKHKTYTFINILGLALGLASSLMIFLWIQDEVSMDKYHTNGPYLYNVLKRELSDGKVQVGRAMPGLLAEELKKQFPEVEYAASYTDWEVKMTFAVGDKLSKESGHWAGADYFHMFSVPLLAGTPVAALNSPNCIAISRKFAQFYFNTPTEALGKTIRIDNRSDYQVTAVFENLPQHSSDQYDFLLGWQDCLRDNPWMKDWRNNGPQTRIQLRSDADLANLEAKLKQFLRKYNPDLGKSYDLQLFLQPFSDSYLYSNFENGKQAGGRIEYVRLFGIIAIFLLLIACINFMNLSTAHSVKRAKEVGIRKVIGASQSSLLGQFMSEALLYTLLSVVVAITLVYYLLPTFNSLAGKHMSLFATQASFYIWLIGITLLTGVIAGSYPALFLSTLKPAGVLKGTLKFGSGARIFRQGLVVFQFVLSTLFIVATIVIYHQVHYLQKANLGYDRENLIYVPVEGELATQTTYQTFKIELLRQPGILLVSSMESIPTRIVNSTTGVSWPGKDPDANIEISHTAVGYDFIKTLKVKLTGRDFSPEFGRDSSSYIINETAAKIMGYKDPIGQPITLWGTQGKIIGVMEDFHFRSLHIPIAPLLIRFSREPADMDILIRTKPGQTKGALSSMEALWKGLNPAFPFSYRFADDEYEKLYKSESVVSSLTKYFAFLSIFISCLGLFGLSAFMAEQRKKEIGVRKVLGASVMGIAGLLAGNFLKLVIIAIGIATPLSWWAMNQWLEEFAYQINLEWWIFAWADVLALGIALLAVSFQSIKAALANPVNSLRDQ